MNTKHPQLVYEAKIMRLLMGEGREEKEMGSGTAGDLLVRK